MNYYSQITKYLKTSEFSSNIQQSTNSVENSECAQKPRDTSRVPAVHCSEPLAVIRVCNVTS